MSGVNKNAQNEDGQTALIIAVSNNNRDMVQLLLENDVDVNIKQTTDGGTALYVACVRDNKEIVQLLLANQHVDVNLQAGDGSSPLYAACYHGYVEVVKLLLAEKRVNVNLRDFDGLSPFHIACLDDQVEVVTLLLTDLRVVVNLRAGDGTSPLYMACNEGHVEVVTLLLADIRVDVNLQDANDGISPFYAACSQGHIGVVTLLLADKRVDVNLQARNTTSPFYTACIKGHVGIVTLLLADIRIDVNLQANNGTSPFYKACLNNLVEMVSLLLADPRVDVNLQANTRNSPLFVACLKGNVEVVRLLLAEPRVDVNLKSADDTSPFYLACNTGHIGLVTLLLADKRVDVNLQANNSSSPLYAACYHGYVEVVRLLLAEPRVDVNLQANGGVSVLHTAIQQNHMDVVKLLVANKRVNVNLKNADGRTPLHLTIIVDGDAFMKLLLKRPDIDITLRDNLDISAIDYVNRIPADKAEAWKKASKLKLLTAERLYIPRGSQNYIMGNEIEDFNELVNLPRINDKYNSYFGNYLRASNNTRKLRRNPVSQIEFPEAQIRTYIARLRPGPPGPKPNMLVRQNIDINRRDAEGNTAFMKAVKAGNTQYVKQLLTIPAIDVNVQDNARHSPFRVACDRNHLAIVKLLLADERLDTYGKLIYSVLAHQLAAISLLLECPRVNVNEATPNGDTSLLLAIKYGPKIPQIRLLMGSARVDKTMPDRRGYTPLFLAIAFKHPEIQDLFKRPMDNGILDPVAEGNPEVLDPTYVDTETLQSAIAKGYIVIKTGSTYFTLDRDETIKAIREGSSVRYQCTSMRDAGIVRFENVENIQYVYIQGNGNYLVPLEEFLNAMIQYPILEFTSTGRTLPYISSAQVIQSLERPLDAEGRPLNRYGQPINIMSADHCQEGTAQVVFKIKGYILGKLAAASATGGASAASGGAGTASAASGGAGTASATSATSATSAYGGAAPRRRKTRSKARVLRKRLVTRSRK